MLSLFRCTLPAFSAFYETSNQKRKYDPFRECFPYFMILPIGARAATRLGEVGGLFVIAGRMFVYTTVQTRLTEHTHTHSMMVSTHSTVQARLTKAHSVMVSTHFTVQARWAEHTQHDGKHPLHSANTFV